MSSRFEQDEVWQTSDGRELKIKKMEPEHVKNVIAMLRRDASNIAFREAYRLFGSANPDMMGEIAYDSVCSMQDEILENPHRWLENTPLMRELVRVDLRNERRIAKRYGVPR
jgi:hypothetical protein